MRYRSSTTYLFLILAMICVLAPVMVFAQATPVAADNPAAPLTQHLPEQFTGSAFVVLLINWIKSSKWFPWITAESAKLNKVVAVIASGLTVIGIHATFDKAGGVLTIQGLTIAGIATMLVAWAKSYIIQQTIYNTTSVQRPAVAAPPAAMGVGAGK